jgi:rSAM/selenodomain-associated transferase 2
MKAPRLSIIVPMLDEAEGIAATLSALRPLGAEVIAVDGGSSDGTIDAAGAHASWVIDAPRGRARQMNAGAAIARGEILLFLHADTALPAQAGRLVGAAIAGGARWGRFDVRIAGASPLFPLIAAMMNLRSRLTGIATGDQAIFVHRDLFAAVGGFPDQPLMEDIALSARLRRIAKPACLRPPVTTSGRRWEKHGVLRTILTMWRLRLRYFFGASPDALAREYGYVPEQP